MNGYMGRILYVDLTEGRTRTEALDPEMARSFLGGWGVNARLAWDAIPPDAGALSPENAVIIGTGPFSGTIVPGSSELSITTKLPLSGGIGTSCGGGHFSLMLKASGYDHVVITGRAAHPVYLKIHNDEVELLPADHLWGRDTYETVDALRLHHEPCSIIPIGPAGENCVGVSVTFIDKGGSLGFGGLPAVMGAKNLKAVVAVLGDQPLQVADRRRLTKAVDRMMERVKSYRLRPKLIKGGTFAMTVEWLSAMGRDSASWEDIHNAVRQPLACPSCPMADKEVKRLRVGEFSPSTAYMTDFMGQDESSAATPLDNHNRAVNRVAIFNRLGICRINFTNVLNLMVSLYDQGILTKDQTGGMEINKDYDTVLKLVEMTARREGFGDIMADGPLGAARRLGPEAEKQAIHIKGCSPFIDPRPDSMNSMAFAQIVHPGRSNYACGGIGIYMQGRPIDQFVHHAERTGMSDESISRTFTAASFEVPWLTKHAEDWYSLFNSLGQCHRLYIHRFHSMDYFLEFYRAITGEEINAAELLRRGERVWNMQKQLNVRLGFGREHDAAPGLWFEPMKVGAQELPMMDYYKQKIITRTDMECMLDEYYEARGWNRDTGAPLPELLKALDLDDFTV
jgi:aldehyde:ferredoxin oxidoreductase